MEAKIAFSLGATTDLPSGLLRMMDRAGESLIGKIHADIAMKPADPANGEERNRVELIAKIPYAEVQLFFGKSAAKIIVFGKTERLSGVPAFLDRSTAAAREALRDAARGMGSIDKALSLRLMRESLDLILSGKRAPNDLRRLYPVGLSGGAAQEIVGNFNLALKTLTMKYRGGAGILALFLFSGLFGLFFFSPIYETLVHDRGPTVRRLIEILVPMASLGGAWFILDRAIRYALKLKFPKARLKASQNIGKIGYSVLTSVILVYVLFFFLATRVFPVVTNPG